MKKYGCSLLSSGVLLLISFISSADMIIRAGDVAVTPTQIFSEYENNALAADGKFKGKKLVVVGVIDTIETNMFDGTPYVNLKASDDEILTLRFKKTEINKLIDVVRGEKIGVKCIGDGGGFGSPLLKECTLERTDISY